MEPTIYKPSIYKGAGVYKTPGVYNGAGVYKAGGNGGIIWTTIYKTFFNDFSNYTDYPEIGAPANYRNCSYKTLTYDNVEYKCMEVENMYSVNDNFPNDNYPYGPVIDLPENTKKLKVETIINAYESRSDFSSIFCGSLDNSNNWNSNDFFLDPIFEQSDPKQFGPKIAQSSPYEYYGNWHSGGFGGFWLKLPKEWNGVSFKRTYIKDYEKAEYNLETYINDELAAIGTDTRTQKQIHPRGVSRNSGHIILWTGLIVSVEIPK